MIFLGIGSNLNSKFGDRFKNINLSKAREMAMNDDALGATQEVLKQMGVKLEFKNLLISLRA